MVHDVRDLTAVTGGTMTVTVIAVPVIAPPVASRYPLDQATP